MPGNEDTSPSPYTNDDGDLTPAGEAYLDRAAQRVRDIDASVCYVIELPDGQEVMLRVWSSGKTHAAHRDESWHVWSPPLKVEVRP